MSPPGLADRLVAWMAENREGLDAMMVEEGSRAIHEAVSYTHLTLPTTPYV